MKIVIKNKLMYRDSEDRDNIIDVSEADRIASANSYFCAEQMTKKFNGMTLDVCDKTQKILGIEEDFI